MEILTYIQIENGEIEEHSLDLISYAREIGNNAVISSVIVTSGENIDFSILKKFGCEKLYLIKTEQKEFDKRKNSYLATKLIKEINPDIFILNSTTEGREIAPVIASELEVGLTADCTKLEIADNRLISTRPTFGGKLMASVMSKKNPQMATLRVNTFKKKEFEIEKFEIVELKYDENLSDMPNVQTEILEFIENKKDFENLENAKIIFAGGMGLKTKENFDKLKLLAKKFNAKTGGTRKAVDKGLIEKEFQIGQTGLTVTPEIYVAFGISGAIHHIIGMENSKKIIAINSDRSAPIFQTADIGIVGDAVKIIESMLE